VFLSKSQNMEEALKKAMSEGRALACFTDG
jgi:hypothetical protein